MRTESGYDYEHKRKKIFWKSFRVLGTVALILCMVAVVLVGTAVYTAQKRTQNEEKQTDVISNTHVTDEEKLKIAKDQESQEEVNQRIQESMNEPGIDIDCRTEIHANSGQTLIQNINLINSRNNTNYYMTYELRLPDSSESGYEVLFKTDLISPGNAIQNVELTRILEAGNYDCVMLAQPYYLTTCTPTNNLIMDVLLIVE